MLVAILAAAVPLLLPQWIAKPPPAVVATVPPAAVDSGPATEPQKEIPKTALPSITSPATEESATLPSSTSEASTQTAEDPARERATKALQTYLRIRARPELDQVEVWGAPQWGDADQVTTAGESALEAALYPVAAERYDQAAKLLSNLIDSRQQRLQESLAAANIALEQDDSLTAIRQFELTLAIDPNHPAATNGLAQAQARPELLVKMETGRMREKEEKLKEALAAYTAASELDPAYSVAAEAVQRIKARILARDFDAAMSKGLAAMQDNQLDLAESTLREASRLQPKHPALQEATAQLAQKQKQRDLSQLRKQADLQNRVEGWQAAEKLYQKALAIDPNTAFAKQGLQKAKDRLQLHQQLDHYLQTPDRLYSTKPFDNARQLLTTASAVDNTEPQLLEKVTTLRRLVEQAGKKVTVRLQSDEKTEVAVYQVGRMGRFDQKTMSLRPGKYTIVGSREGYRDVRRVVEVHADAEPQPILIRCTEPL